MPSTDDVTAVLDDHPAFTADDEGYRLTTLAVPCIVRVREGTLVVEVTLPTLDAVVRDGVVPELVVEEWFETLDRRLATGYDVTRTPPAADPDIRRVGDTITVQYALAPEDPAVCVADAKALAEFAQGTYVQGAIPGFEYGPPLGELVAGAWETGDG